MPRRCRDRLWVCEESIFVCDRQAGHSGTHVESQHLIDPADGVVSRPYTMSWGDPVIREADLTDLSRLPTKEPFHAYPA